MRRRDRNDPFLLYIVGVGFLHFRLGVRYPETEKVDCFPSTCKMDLILCSESQCTVLATL